MSAPHRQPDRKPDLGDPSPLDTFATWFDREIQVDPKGKLDTDYLFAQYRHWARPREFRTLDLRTFVQQLEAKGAVRAANDGRPRVVWRLKHTVVIARPDPADPNLEAEARLIAAMRRHSLVDTADVDVVTAREGEDSGWRVAVYFRAERWRLHPAEAIIIAGRLHDEPLEQTRVLAERLSAAACRAMYREVETSRLSEAELAVRRVERDRGLRA